MSSTLSVIVVLVVLACHHSSSIRVAPIMWNIPVQFCGSQLSDFMSQICQGRYYDFMPKGLTRFKRAKITDECCHSKCLPKDLIDYCTRDEQILRYQELSGIANKPDPKQIMTGLKNQELSQTVNKPDPKQNNMTGLRNQELSQTANKPDQKRNITDKFPVASKIINITESTTTTTTEKSPTYPSFITPFDLFAKKPVRIPFPFRLF